MVADEQDARFTRLYERFYPRVLGYALRRVRPEQAHEVVAETFLIAWRRRAENPDPTLPWLLVTARQVISDQFRQAQRQDAIAVELARCAAQTTQAGADVIVAERIAVLTALAQLAEPDRNALMLSVWDGLSNREAAAVSGCSTATFTVRLHRARRRLAAALDEVDVRSQPRAAGRKLPGKSSRSASVAVRPAPVDSL